MILMFSKCYFIYKQQSELRQDEGIELDSFLKQLIISIIKFVRKK